MWKLLFNRSKIESRHESQIKQLEQIFYDVSFALFFNWLMIEKYNKNRRHDSRNILQKVCFENKKSLQDMCSIDICIFFPILFRGIASECGDVA